MMYHDALKSVTALESRERPFVASYDSGYEYTLEHWVALRRLLEESDRDASRPARGAA